MQSPFANVDETQPPLQADEFKSHIVQEYAEQASSVGIEACIGEAVDAVWPAPGYRAHQKEAVVDILKNLYVDDRDVVTLSAPTGAGKSLILHAAMAVIANEFDRNSFFTTPLNALIDQVDNDEFIEDEVLTLKGKNNYQCVHSQDRGAPVDKAVCQRVSDFDCEYKEQHHEQGGCPYYGRKHAAKMHPEVVTNLSYLMANSMIPEEYGLSSRELVTIDECQSIEDFALGFVEVVVIQRSVPVVWDLIPDPPATDNVEQLAEWLENDVLPPVRRKLDEYEGLAELTEEQSDNQEQLERFAQKCHNLAQDVRDNHWVANREVDDEFSDSSSESVQSDSTSSSRADFKVEFRPIYIGRFLERFLWSQGHKVILSSATIPKGGFLEEIGLDDRQVGEVEVPSTFPVERRPVYTDATVGKMNYKNRDQTIPKMARKIGDIADHHNDGNPHRGFVHCHSYKIAERIYKAMPRDVQARTRIQDGDNREESLEDWLDAPVDETGLRGGYNKYQDDGRNKGGQVFLSVAMDEGISLDDWRARWQVVAKAAYPYMGKEAKRTNYRVNELNDWVWYSGKAAINLQQAVGRGMRSKDDWCHTYILDESAATLIERNKHLFEDWFLDAVDVAANSDLPDRS